jgi:hypothetical protein
MEKKMGLFGKERKYHDHVKIQRKSVLEIETKELAELALAGLECDQLPNSRGDFGHFFRNPIITNGTYGTLIYLGKLVVEQYQTALIFHKLGSIKNSLTNIGTIDIYEVMDESAKHWDILFIDMFHPRRSNITPNGYYFREYDKDMGDMNNAFGVVNTCDKFPNKIITSLIASGNSRYAMVEQTLKDLEDKGISINPPEEHRKKVETIKQILEQQRGEEDE